MCSPPTLNTMTPVAKRAIADRIDAGSTGIRSTTSFTDTGLIPKPSEESWEKRRGPPTAVSHHGVTAVGRRAVAWR
ncbi:hypothetical protein GCM10017779_61160 [Streptomyces capillispiralis]|nr:hypothetical protein GCM10017779_61160 [Streptomyces capillispiralis]